jgi:hypothetical protein
MHSGFDLNQHPRLPVPTADRHKSLPTNKLLLSILPFKNRFIFDKTRQNQRLDAKHYSVTAYGGFY